MTSTEKFESVCRKVESMYGNKFMFAALYGSQNYGFSTPDSDVDVKVGMLPDPVDLLLVEKRHATTLTENGSKDNTVLVKDLRDVFQEFYKQNLNFLEVLVSPWYYTSDFFNEAFMTLRWRSNEVARYYEKGFNFCMCGLFNKLNADLEKGQFDYKKFTYGLFLRDFLTAYNNGASFIECFDNPNAEWYRTLRVFKSLDQKYCVRLWAEAKEKMDSYFQKAQAMSSTKNDLTKKWMDELLYDMVWKFVVLNGNKRG